MGILSNHVPSIEVLRPGVLEVMETKGSQKFFGWFLLRNFFSLQPTHCSSIKWIRNCAPQQCADY